MNNGLASRRGFLQKSAAFGSAASYGRILGANDRLQLGVIGAGGRGRYLLKQTVAADLADIAAVCDIYDVRRQQAAKMAARPVKEYADHRRVLEHGDIDAVIVATPDHWHASITIDACRAGKDVYCEKPFVHHPKDGLAVVKAVRDNKRILQVGTQQRGQPQFIDAKRELVDSGVMGKVGLVRTWYTSNAGYIKEAPKGMEAKPAGLDWDRWLGPGPKVPWNPGIYFSPYKWLHYDGGMIMGIGIHVIDSAHHLLGLEKPKAAVAGGGIYFYNDGRDSPDVVTCSIDYPQNVTVTFEAECLSAPGVKSSAGVQLRGTGGVLTVLRYQPKDAWVYEPNGKFSKTPAAKGDGAPPDATPMLRDWFDCIRSRRRTIANEEVAYYSTMACFMVNQAFRTQSRVAWDNRWNLPA
jgi:predicted dehydrogenase